MDDLIEIHKVFIELRKLLDINKIEYDNEKCDNLDNKFCVYFTRKLLEIYNGLLNISYDYKISDTNNNLFILKFGIYDIDGDKKLVAVLDEKIKKYQNIVINCYYKITFLTDWKLAEIPTYDIINCNDHNNHNDYYIYILSHLNIDGYENLIKGYFEIQYNA